MAMAQTQLEAFRNFKVFLFPLVDFGETLPSRGIMKGLPRQPPYHFSVEGGYQGALNSVPKTRQPL